MFFLKPKPKIDEVLPPPPPEAEFGEQFKEDKEEHKFFEETTKPEEDTEIFTGEKEIGDLAKDLDIELEPQKEVSKKEKTTQKAKVTKKQKIPKKIELKKSMSVKTTKLKKPIKIVKKEAKKIEAPKSKEKPDISKEINLTKTKTLPEDKEFEDLFNEVKALKPKEVKEEMELPETLEDFEKDLRQEKPTEILEAEEEIKSAIDKIKKQEKTSFFKRLFSGKEKVQEKPIEEHISIIQNSINKAKDALIKFDLETAKKNYIEIMKIYNTIKPEEQSKVYHDIKELYFERKSAEGLKA